MREHLAQMMLIEVLRLQVNRKEPQDIGWLSAISDRQLHSALSAMHGDPGHRWTLGGLAERAAMSRSAFALRFKTKVGISAMEYLTRWRMLLAADRIVNSEDSISTISRALGYESESAFSFAFKREMGCSPRQYSQNRS